MTGCFKNQPIRIGDSWNDFSTTFFFIKIFCFSFGRRVINEKYRLITEKLWCSVGYAPLARTNKSKSNMCRTFNYSTHLFETCYFNLFVEWFELLLFFINNFVNRTETKIFAKVVWNHFRNYQLSVDFQDIYIHVSGCIARVNIIIRLIFINNITCKCLNIRFFKY